MVLQLTQRGHGTDGKFRFRLLHGVQPQSAEINGGADAAPAQLQPQHAAENAAALFLVQLPSLLQTLRFYVIADGYHV